MWLHKFYAIVVKLAQFVWLSTCYFFSENEQAQNAVAFKDSEVAKTTVLLKGVSKYLNCLLDFDIFMFAFVNLQRSAKRKWKVLY